ncbi:hypothetical protein RMSM_05658 [Rhodopirellula maiorica SM1]|uniref:Uncharacterized protein n=1 Tax=Rhodopirellula maiorica SM1 TaxID=1265738 RepID=M5RTY1_9BACT|nr:hypothetical protein RMSM_05658 [Rhodopirellula maiorica SM1]
MQITIAKGFAIIIPRWQSQRFPTPKPTPSGSRSEAGFENRLAHRLHYRSFA